jgi:hypothetical protein
MLGVIGSEGGMCGSLEIDEVEFTGKLGLFHLGISEGRD